MSLHKDEGECFFTAVCDFCGDVLETDAHTWQDGIEAMKKVGWKIFPIKGTWFHKCGCCQAESAGHDFEDVS